jgi:hypothetical protein
MQKADITEQQASTTSLSEKDLQDARQVINIFIQAWKNYGLYPEDHVNTKILSRPGRITACIRRIM